MKKAFVLGDALRILGIAIILIVVVILFCFYIIGRQTENSLKELSNKVLTAADYYVAGQILDGKPLELNITFPDNTALGIKGNLPKNGFLKIDLTGKVEMRFYDGGYCVNKKFDASTINITKTNKKECLKTVE